MRAWTSSGSAWSEDVVNPTRSQNKTVTDLRSSTPRVIAREAPQCGQNLYPTGLSWPQFGHTGMASSLGVIPSGVTGAGSRRFPNGELVRRARFELAVASSSIVGGHRSPA